MPFNHKIILYEDTGWTRLIQCHSSTWISFEISGNKKLIVHFKHISQKLQIKLNFELTVFELTVSDLYTVFRFV